MTTKSLALTLIAATCTLALTACDKSETEGKPTVTATEPVEETTKPAETTGAAKTPDAESQKMPADPLAAIDGVSINKDTSSVEWVGAKITGDHKGDFKKIDGEIKLGDDGNLSMLAFVVDTTSVTSDNEKLTAHLMSADFFDVAKYPTASFVSTSITPGSDVKANEGQEDFTHTITGNMDLRGQKKSITFPARVDTSGDMVQASTEFNLMRKDFGIVYAGKPDDLIKDEVLMKIKLEAPKQ